MIEKFKNFDSVTYLNSKSLKESNDANEIVDDQMDLKVEDVLDGTPVYNDKYLSKISNIVGKKLLSANIGKFGVYHDVIYLDGVPSVWFYGLDDNTRNIVCSRNANIKSISVFNEFSLDKKCKATVTYSTEKFGFKDMIEQMIEDFKSGSSINEELLTEAGGFGDGYSANNIANFKKLAWVDKEFMYNLVSTTKKGDAKLKMLAGLNSNDRDIMRILKTFGSATPGSAKYIVGLALDVLSKRYQGVNKDMDDLITEYERNGNGAGPAIGVYNDAEFEVSDLDEAEEARAKARDEAQRKELEADLENYTNTIEGLKDVTSAMCNYVKQHGHLDVEDESIMSRRGVLLTGKGGIGKTHTLVTTLKEKNMIKNTDYIWIGSESIATDKLYTLMYEYNGKLLVFDDTADIFDGKYALPVWKQALQTDIEQAEIGYPGRDSGLNVYDDRALKSDRQRRYFVEIGRKSAVDKADFYNKAMKKYGVKWTIRQGPKHMVPTSTSGLDEAEAAEIEKKIDNAWKEEENNTKPAMPKHFIFTGVVIIISNLEREQFKAEVGNGNWTAIKTRFKNFDISPRSESLWAAMKKMILTEFNDSTIPDEKCAIPRDITEEFIEEVENLIVDPTYQGISWRTIKAMGKTLRGSRGRKIWKRELRDDLKIL